MSFETIEKGVYLINEISDCNIPRRITYSSIKFVHPVHKSFGMVVMELELQIPNKEKRALFQTTHR